MNWKEAFYIYDAKKVLLYICLLSSDITCFYHLCNAGCMCCLRVGSVVLFIAHGEWCFRLFIYRIITGCKQRIIATLGFVLSAKASNLKSFLWSPESSCFSLVFVVIMGWTYNRGIREKDPLINEVKIIFRCCSSYEIKNQTRPTLPEEVTSGHNRAPCKTVLTTVASYS